MIVWVIIVDGCLPLVNVVVADVTSVKLAVMGLICLSVEVLLRCVLGLISERLLAYDV